MKLCNCGRKSTVVESRTMQDGNVFRVRRCGWCYQAWRTVERMIPWNAVEEVPESAPHTYRVKEGWEHEVLS